MFVNLDNPNIMEPQTAGSTKHRCAYQGIKSLFGPKTTNEIANTVITKGFSAYHLSEPGTEVHLYRSIFNVPVHWDVLAPEGNVFMQRSYLEVLELNPPKGMQFGYLLFYYQDQPVGISICQNLLFDTAETLSGSFNETSKGLAKIWNQIKQSFAKRLKFNLLISGSALLTGQHL